MSKSFSKYKNKRNKSCGRLLSIIVVLALLAIATTVKFVKTEGLPWTGGLDAGSGDSISDAGLSIDEVPEYSGEPYIEINGNEPTFTEEEITTEAYEKYSELDKLGRCGAAEACIGRELMPTGERRRAFNIRPSGWNTAHYDFVDRGMLFNRSHLIAFHLTGEDLNEKNLITGTRYMNAFTMLPFEEQVGNWVRRTGKHVMYRVTPVFRGRELVARGVHMEARSVEDGGRAVSFNVYLYNVQPGVEIDYATGNNRLAEGGGEAPRGSGDGRTREAVKSYVVNTRSRKFHDISCPGTADIADRNRKDVRKTRDELIDEGYDPCGCCNP